MNISFLIIICPNITYKAESFDFFYNTTSSNLLWLTVFVKVISG